MSRLLAIDWDRREARFVLVSAKGEQLTLITAARVAVSSGELEEGAESGIGVALRAALAEHKVGHPDMLLGIGRGDVELLHLTLPPATDAELPELVLNQALRETQGSENAVVDFVSNSDVPDEPRKVTAAVLAPEQRIGIKAICSEAGVKPKRMILRSYAAASLFIRSGKSGGKRCLLVSQMADEIGLTALVDDRVVFSRTARLPETDDADHIAETINAEINRTLAVALHDQLGGSPISEIFLFGSEMKQGPLARMIEERQSISVTVLDPFEAGGVQVDSTPDHGGRFASLVGMLADESHDAAHAMDFLHPKRPPKARNYRRPLIMAVAGLLLAAAYVGFDTWSQRSKMAKEIQALVAKQTEYAAKYRTEIGRRTVLTQLQAWDGSINWLDELRAISIIAPPPRDLLLTRLALTPGANGGGTISFSGMARDESVLRRLEDLMRQDNSRGLKTERIQDQEGNMYGWSFQGTIKSLRRPPNYYFRHRPPEPATPQADATTTQQTASPNTATTQQQTTPSNTTPQAQTSPQRSQP